MAATDDFQRRCCWDAGRIPIRILVANIDQVPPLYLHLPRGTYLHLYLSTIRRHFSRFLVHREHVKMVGSDLDIWFSSEENEPLPWHQPIGLLFDLFAMRCHKLNGLEYRTQCSEIPWTIRCHLTSDQIFPHERILRVSSHDALYDSFMASVKEADQIRYGSVQRVMSLARQDQLQLWEALRLDNFIRFKEISEKLIMPNDRIRHIPIKFYMKNITVVQDLVSVLNDDETLKTFKDALSQISPLFNTILHNYLLVSHGILIPLETPLIWAASRLIYPDQFVHIVLHDCDSIRD